jgi:hypothetical protein
MQGGRIARSFEEAFVSELEWRRFSVQGNPSARPRGSRAALGQRRAAAWHDKRRQKKATASGEKTEVSRDRPTPSKRPGLPGRREPSPIASQGARGAGDLVEVDRSEVTSVTS